MYVHFRQKATSRDKRDELNGLVQRNHSLRRQDVWNNQKNSIALLSLQNTSDAQSVQYEITASKARFSPLAQERRHKNSALVLDLAVSRVFPFESSDKAQEVIIYTSELWPKCFCMDSTHGTNQHDFKCITVMVADQFGDSFLISLLHIALVDSNLASCAKRTIG